MKNEVDVNTLKIIEDKVDDLGPENKTGDTSESKNEAYNHSAHKNRK